MASKNELQDILKDKFGINKNISQALSQAECETLLDLLIREPSAAKLVEAYADKNNSLGRNNAFHGRARNQAERKLETLKTEYQQLEDSIQTLERKKHLLEAEQKTLESQVQSLSAHNQALESKVQTLTTQKDELSEANTQLKKENKDLKNIVDQIRLRLARDTKLLLQYEDSEIRKALIRLFRWTLG